MFSGRYLSRIQDFYQFPFHVFGRYWMISCSLAHVQDSQHLFDDLSDFSGPVFSRQTNKSLPKALIFLKILGFKNVQVSFLELFRVIWWWAQERTLWDPSMDLYWIVGRFKGPYFEYLLSTLDKKCVFRCVCFPGFFCLMFFWVCISMDWKTKYFAWEVLQKTIFA